MRDDDRLEDLKAALADRAEELCLDLFGQPTRKAAHEWRWGNQGSLMLKLRGKGAPRIYDFAAGRGGSMLDAIALAQDHLRLADSIAWAKDWLGLAATERRKIQPRRNDAFDVEADGEQAARAIWDASSPITGTPAETYLRSRGIKASTWPTSIRWNAGGSIVFSSTAPDGRLTAVQRVFLKADGAPVTEEDGKGGRRKIKRSRGPRYGGSVRFAGSTRPNVLILAEGPETALSIWHATGMECWSTIGPTHSVNLDPVPLDRIILVALDDDGRNAQVRKHTVAAIRRWRAEGRTVLTAMPWPSSRRDRSDFNDALQERGPAYVAEIIDAALTPKRDHVVRLPIADARAATTAAVSDALDELLAPRDETTRPAAIALKIGTGIGKTECGLREIIARMIGGELKTVSYAVPENELSAELVARAEAIRDELGGSFEIGAWRGREAANPDQPGQAMCERPDVVRAVGRAGLDVQTFACRTPEGVECPFYQSCAYQAQRRQRRRLTITTHATIFAKKAKGIPTPELLVIDESFWGQGLFGTDNHHKIMTPLNELEGFVSVTHEHGRDLFGTLQARAEADAMADLEPVRGKLRRILASAHIGPLRREHIEGMTPEACRAAANAEHRRIVVPKLSPAMTGAEIMRRLDKAAPNAGCRRRAALFDAIAAFIEGPVEASGNILIDRTDDGAPAFRSLGRRPLGDGWGDAPVLLLDATLRPELVTPSFPNLKVAAEIEAETPNMRVEQYFTKSFAKSHFRDTSATGPWAADRKAVNQLWTWCKAQLQKRDGTALVVTQKGIEEAIRAHHNVAPHISLGHHNALAGKDGWRDVSTLITAGRTQPPPEAVEAIAMALGGEWIDPAVLPTDSKDADGRPRRWYAAAAHTVADRAGNIVTLSREHHPHPLAEAARAGCCEDQLVQIIGRARGVNRTEDNPVLVLVLADVPLPIQVDEFRPWIPASLDDAMLSEGCWTESAEDAARFWPEIIRNAKSLKDARHRGQSVDFSYNRLQYENSTHCTRLTYQKPGPRQRPVAAIFDRRLIPDPEQWLRDRLGPVNVLFLDAEAVLPRKTRRKAAKAPPEPRPVPVGESPPPPDPYQGGILPEIERRNVRDQLRALGWRHGDIADAIGLSRPQFTNALNGTFGLSRDAAARLADWMHAPPDGPIQPDLNL